MVCCLMIGWLVTWVKQKKEKRDRQSGDAMPLYTWRLSAEIKRSDEIKRRGQGDEVARGLSVSNLVP